MRNPRSRPRLAAAATAACGKDGEELDVDDEIAIDRALASVRAGRGVSLAKFRTILNRL